MKDVPVKVIRSPRRKKTISARLSGGELLVYLPARMSRKEEHKWVSRMKERLSKRSRRIPESDSDLKTRAEELNKKYFGGKLRIESIIYSDNQKRRYGSCQTMTGSIRISRRLASMPVWVLDYVIVHELAHLVHSNHSKSFWDLVNMYRYVERSKGFLIAKDLEEDGVV